MKRNLWPTRDSVKDYFPLPKEIFSLGLSAAEIAIYAYLLFCEDRQTFQCWPSYRKIGEAVELSPNTIRKHIRLLEERSLLITEPTLVTTKDGKTRMLLQQASICEEYRNSAEIYTRYGEAQVSAAAKYIGCSCTEDIGLFKAVQEEF